MKYKYSRNKVAEMLNYLSETEINGNMRICIIRDLLATDQKETVKPVILKNSINGKFMSTDQLLEFAKACREVDDKTVKKLPEVPKKISKHIVSKPYWDMAVEDCLGDLIDWAKAITERLEKEEK